MAEIIIAAITRRKQDPGATGGGLAGRSSALDYKAARREDIAHIEAVIENISVDAHVLSQRVVLEVDMRSMWKKLPFFLVGLSCFMASLYMLVPSASIARVHKHIIDAFHLDQDSLDEIQNFDSIYSFVKDFEHTNEKFQATSYVYWCEDRYHELVWDDHYLVPRSLCPSPRLHSLAFHTIPPMSHACWEATGANSRRRRSGLLEALAEDDASFCPSEVSAHRRLAEDTHSDSNHSGCADNDALLKIEEGDDSLTCENFKTHICEVDLALELCPVTCGYCSPFSYHHSKNFDKPQVTMLPVMVHQTRFEEQECHGFGELYEHQHSNEDLSILPALDGERGDHLLTCIDRTKHTEEEYMMHIECSADAPDYFCPNGTMKHTKVHTFHGLPIYPVRLNEPDKQLSALQEIGWLDMHTDEFTVSTLVYTENVEIFSSVSVVFKLDAGGNMRASVLLISVHDLTGSNKTTFLALLGTCFAVSLIGLAFTGFDMWKKLKCKCNWAFDTFELFSRTTLTVYSMVLLVWFMQTTSMATQYTSLLDGTLNYHGHSEEELEDLIQDFYDTKTNIYNDNQALYWHRCVSYIICFMQFLQFIMYSANHPRLAMLTSTVFKAWDQLVHFFILFTVVFAFLSFTAYWMLGGDVLEFKSIGEALASMVRMLYGEYIRADGAAEVSGILLTMYWVFANVFLTVCFFTLLNVFLAIVVDGFMEVKGDMEENTTESNFVYDSMDALFSSIRYFCMGWPDRFDIKVVLDEVLAEREAEEKDNWMTLLEWQEKFPERFPTRSLAKWAISYFKKIPDAFRLDKLPEEDEVASVVTGRSGRVKTGLMKGMGAVHMDDVMSEINLQNRKSMASVASADIDLMSASEPPMPTCRSLPATIVDIDGYLEAARKHCPNLPRPDEVGDPSKVDWDFHVFSLATILKQLLAEDGADPDATKNGAWDPLRGMDVDAVMPKQMATMLTSPTNQSNAGLSPRSVVLRTTPGSGGMSNEPASPGLSPKKPHGGDPYDRSGTSAVDAKLSAAMKLALAKVPTSEPGTSLGNVELHQAMDLAASNTSRPDYSNGNGDKKPSTPPAHKATSKETQLRAQFSSVQCQDARVAIPDDGTCHLQLAVREFEVCIQVTSRQRTAVDFMSLNPTVSDVQGFEFRSEEQPVAELFVLDGPAISTANSWSSTGLLQMRFPSDLGVHARVQGHVSVKLQDDILITLKLDLRCQFQDVVPLNIFSPEEREVLVAYLLRKSSTLSTGSTSDFQAALPGLQSQMPWLNTARLLQLWTDARMM